MTFVSALGALLLASNTTNTAPCPAVLASSGTGNDLSCAHVAEPSLLFHSPLRREPKSSVLGWLGSTARRSPLARAFSLPPSLIGKSVRWYVLPRSLERSMPPVGAQLWLYMPSARYSLFGSLGSSAMLSKIGRAHV